MPATPATSPDTKTVMVLVRATAQYLPSRLVPAVAGAVTVPLVASQLTPAEFGTFSLITAALPFLAVVAADWVIAGHQRFAHVDRSPQATLWVTLLSTGMATVLLLSWSVSRQVELLALSLLLPPYMLMRLQSIDLQMTSRAKRYSIHTCTYSLLRSLLVIWAAQATGHLGWVLVAWLAASLVTVVTGPRMPWRARPSRTSLRKLGGVGLPLVAAALAINVSATADRFIIAAMEGRAATGVYSFGYIIGETVVALPLMLPFLAAQVMATRRWDSGDQAGTERFLRKVLLAQTAVGAVAVVLLSTLGERVFVRLAPAEYLAASGLMVTVGSAQLMAAAAYYFVLLASLQHRTRRLIAPSALTAVFSVVLTAAAVSVGGLAGAAVATAATYAVQLILLQRAVKTVLLDRISLAVVLLLTSAAACTALGSPPLRTAGLVVLVAAGGFQCVRAIAMLARSNSAARGC